MRIAARIKTRDGRQMKFSGRKTAHSLAKSLRGVSAAELELTIELTEESDLTELVKHLPQIALCFPRGAS